MSVDKSVTMMSKTKKANLMQNIRHSSYLSNHFMCPAGVEGQTGDKGWDFRELLCQDGRGNSLHLIGLW